MSGYNIDRVSTVHSNGFQMNFWITTSRLTNRRDAMISYELINETRIKDNLLLLRQLVLEIYYECILKMEFTFPK
jgi:hypothetical protein